VGEGDGREGRIGIRECVDCFILLEQKRERKREK
jgi:hypothetical protein